MVLSRRAALPAVWSELKTMSPQLNGMRNLAEMETGMHSFELTVEVTCLKVTCLTSDSTVSLRLRGSCLLLGLAIRNTSEIRN